MSLLQRPAPRRSRIRSIPLLLATLLFLPSGTLAQETALLSVGDETWEEEIEVLEGWEERTPGALR